MTKQSYFKRVHRHLIDTWNELPTWAKFLMAWEWVFYPIVFLFGMLTMYMRDEDET